MNLIHASNKTLKRNVKGMPHPENYSIYCSQATNDDSIVHSKQKKFNSKVNSRLRIPFKIYSGLHQVKERRGQTLGQACGFVVLLVFFFPLKS